MPAVRVLPVNSVGRDLITFSIHPDSHGTVLDPGIYSLFKDLLHLMWKRRGRDIPIIGFPAKKAVADAASHHIGLEPRPTKKTYYLFYIFR